MLLLLLLLQLKAFNRSHGVRRVLRLLILLLMCLVQDKVNRVGVVGHDLLLLLGGLGNGRWAGCGRDG